MNLLIERLLKSKHFGVPKPLRKFFLAPLKKNPTAYTRANRVLSGYERRLNYSVNEAAAEILNLRRGFRAPCFIDCGFNEGNVLGKFRSALPGFHFVGYEVQKDLFDMVSTRMPDCQLIHAAVSNRNGTAQLKLGANFTYNVRGGTSIVGGHLKDHEIAETTEVACVDFRHVLNDLRETHDFIAVKMDIEGAEYDVLEHVLAEPAKLIDSLIIEYHPETVGRERHEHVANLVRERKIPLIEWY